MSNFSSISKRHPIDEKLYNQKKNIIGIYQKYSNNNKQLSSHFELSIPTKTTFNIHQQVSSFLQSIRSDIKKNITQQLSESFITKFEITEGATNSNNNLTKVMIKINDPFKPKEIDDQPGYKDIPLSTNLSHDLEIMLNMNKDIDLEKIDYNQLDKKTFLMLDKYIKERLFSIGKDFMPLINKLLHNLDIDPEIKNKAIQMLKKDFLQILAIKDPIKKKKLLKNLSLKFSKYILEQNNRLQKLSNFLFSYLKIDSESEDKLILKKFLFKIIKRIPYRTGTYSKTNLWKYIKTESDKNNEIKLLITKYAKKQEVFVEYDKDELLNKIKLFTQEKDPKRSKSQIKTLIKYISDTINKTKNRANKMQSLKDNENLFSKIDDITTYFLSLLKIIKQYPNKTNFKKIKTTANIFATLQHKINIRYYLEKVKKWKMPRCYPI